ncbi:MAG: molybdopterin-dependent oxidoreductase [Burkholderiales bacterium]|nr:molybdopterin-dependent oxidoreductase [Burkholderiales bacterium]
MQCRRPKSRVDSVRFEQEKALTTNQEALEDGTRVFHGACPHDCPDTCAVQVKVRDGRVVGVRGRRDHPFTDGRLCVKVNHFEERVNHPERVLYPLRRTGPKGSGQFERIGWDEALAEIGRRWRGLIAEHGAQAILPCGYLGNLGLLQGLNVGDPFFNRLGATVSERSFCGSGATTGTIMTLGGSPGTEPESFVHSRYIILWACNLISTGGHHWPIIAEARRRGAKVVVIDPVRGRTARQADWHLAIRPGTDGALALGLVNVLVAEDLIDRDYVERHTVGFDALTTRAAEYTPERVAAITGLDAEDVRRLAREYATAQPSVIRIGVALERHPGGGNAARLIAGLPALVGAWRHVGGGFLYMPIAAFPVHWDRLMRADLLTGPLRVLNLWKLGAALTGRLALDPPIRSLFVYNCNPAVTLPRQDWILEGLAREDLFTVVSEHFVTDTARYADLVLPATTQPEHLDIVVPWGHLYLTYNAPAVPPAGEAVANTELFRRLAREMGFDDPCFRATDRELLEQAFDWSHPALADIDLARLERDGFARLAVPDSDRWVPHAEGGFPTPSGKVELVASMAAGGNFVVSAYRQGHETHQDGSVVPAVAEFIPPRADPDHPLVVLSPKSHFFINSNFANVERQLAHAGEQAVTLHPDDAAARAVEEGDRVEVRNARGAFQAIARISHDVAPGVVVAVLGHWPGRTIGGRGVNAVTDDAYADLGRAPLFSDTRVEIRRL